MKKPGRKAARKTTIDGDVNAARDVVFGDQITTDLTRVETLLAQIVQALSAPQSTVSVGGDVERAVMVVGDGNEIRLTPADVDALGQLQHVPHLAALDRERLYLIRAIIDRYARWERGYLPLADLREALTVYHKTRVVLLGEPGAGKTTSALARRNFSILEQWPQHAAPQNFAAPRPLAEPGSTRSSRH